MASTFEKSVKGATKVKLAAPKSKYVEHILIATHSGEAGIAEVFRALNHRLMDSTWTIVFKSLIIVHLMMREGEKDVTLKYLRKNPRIIAISNFTDAQEQGRNIRHYSQYLYERARSYGDVKVDYVRNGEGRLRDLSIDKGLIREVECVQQQIKSLLKCSFLDLEVDNEITLTAFRLLVMDLMAFFHVLNEGVINLLGHYLGLSKFDAERVLEIYKLFTKQTADVVEYLQTARRLETSTRLRIPNLVHAPTSLTQSLEEHLRDPNFDTNRRQWLAEHEAKKNGATQSSKKVTESKPSASKTTSSPKAAASQPAAAAPAPASKPQADLIDFFDSIETPQVPMFPDANPYHQQVDQQQLFQQQELLQQQQQAQLLQQQALQAQFTQGNNFIQGGFGQQPPMPQGTDLSAFSQGSTQAVPVGIPQPLQPVQTHFTGYGFGGYTPQDQVSVTPPMPSMPQQYQQGIVQEPQFSATPLPTQSMYQQPSSLQPQQTSSNPFRQPSVMSKGPSPAATGFGSPAQTSSTNPFARAAAAQQSATTGNTPQTVASFATGPASEPAAAPLRPSTTGTNPFQRGYVSQSSPPVPPMPTGLSTTPSSVGMLTVQPTGTTNPFRASMMMQQQQQAQQLAQQQIAAGQPVGSVAGWENIPTIPVFPRQPGGAGAPAGQPW